MQVSKWGNSLAVRLPKSIVVGLGLKQGDDIEVVVAGDRRLEVRREMTREEALKRLGETRRPLPPGFIFNREEANER
jgi:antitoxin MazE